MGKRVEDVNTYRVGHPLAQRVLGLGRGLAVAPAAVTFGYRESGRRIAALEPFVRQTGWLSCCRLTVTAMETEDHLFFTGETDGGEALDDSQCRRFFDLPGTIGALQDIPESVATRHRDAQERRAREILEELATRNARWFDVEMDKLDRWAEDRRTSLKATLDELDDALKVAKRAARLAPNLPEKLERQREARTLETKRDEAWRDFDQASREVDRKKDELLDEIGRRLEQTAERESLFTVRWHLR